MQKRGKYALFLPSGEDGFGQRPTMWQGTSPLQVHRAEPYALGELSNINICNFQGSFELIFFTQVFHTSLDTTTMQYNAKGNFYATMEEGIETYQGTADVPYEVTVVYDRVSDDGQSHMFIQYKIYSTSEGTVTDFGLRYYVNMYTGEVRAEEVPWGN